MMMRPMQRGPQRPDYGLDGPSLLAAFGALASLGLAGVAVMLWSSKVGKLRARDALIDAIPWRGDEQVLDVGCGRGMLLIAAAKRLTTGRAIGVDVWHSRDQADNRPDATWANAHAEGVAERIEVRDGDARQLPFADNAFDVVVSSLVIHNIPGDAGRARAIREMVRVLKPGGAVAILDVAHTDTYAQELQACGVQLVNRSRPRFLFFSPARIVNGTKC
jgi:arsenite methyltransferase